LKNLKKRNELPNFIQLSYIFDIKKIIDSLNSIPEDFNDLNDLDGYGKVAESCPCLEEIFGLKFNTIESAYNYLRNNGIKPENMNWDYTKFVKNSKKGIKLKNNPYKQMALTEFNPVFNSKKFNVQIPKSRLDERQYNKIKPWVKNTYLEKVLSTFKGSITRARISRMEPGCVIDEHIDYNTNYSIRVHIPIRTNDKSGFYVRRSLNGKKDYIKMPADGRCWFLNQGYRHSAWNKGNTPRDHLVLSIVGQEDLTINTKTKSASKKLLSTGNVNV